MIQNDTKYVKSEFRSALHGKCPKCRRGKMFASGTFLNQKMNEKCPHCGFHFEVEPGYFYVAMFVSFAMNIIIMVTFGVGTYLITHSEDPWLYLPIVLIPPVLFSPLTFRYSRIVLLFWLTAGVHFEPNRAADDYGRTVN
jgi:uncharacterized protein (DUF983 family)